MGVIEKIKSVLGLGNGADTSRDRDTEVVVEHEPEVDSDEGSVDGAPKPSTEADEGVAEAEPTTGPSSDDEATEDEPEAETPEAEPESDISETELEADTPETEPEAETGEPTDGDQSVQTVSGIGPAYADRLADAGIETIDDLVSADPESLAESADLSAKRIERWQDRATE